MAEPVCPAVSSSAGGYEQLSSSKKAQVVRSVFSLYLCCACTCPIGHLPSLASLLNMKPQCTGHYALAWQGLALRWSPAPATHLRKLRPAKRKNLVLDFTTEMSPGAH